MIKIPPIAEESFFFNQQINFLKNLRSSKNQKIARIPTPLDDLNDIERLATELKAKWIPYRVILEEILVQYGKKMNIYSLYDWFDASGKLRPALDYLQKKHTTDREIELEKADAKLREVSIDAIGVLSGAVTGQIKNSTQIDAAKDILNRTGFPAVSKIEGKHELESDSMKEVAEAMKKIAGTIK